MIGVLHHGLAAGIVVLFDADALSDVFLGDAQLLLHAEFDGQTVGIPTGFSLHSLSLQRLVATEQILDRAGQHMVDPRHTIGRGRPFIEDKGFGILSQFHGAIEGFFILPFLLDRPMDLREVQLFVFGKTAHGSL